MDTSFPTVQLTIEEFNKLVAKTRQEWSQLDWEQARKAINAMEDD